MEGEEGGAARGGECGLPLGAFYDQLLAKEKKDKSLLGLFCVAARPPKWRVAKRRGGGDAAGRHEGWARAAMPLVFARTICECDAWRGEASHS